MVRVNRGGRPRKQRNDPEVLERGFITIPYNVEKSDYIETCYRTGTVSVLSDGGNLRNEVLITNEALQNIDFPTEEGGEGTQVIIASLPYRTNPIIIGTITNRNNSPAWSSNMHRFVKFNEDTSVCIEMSADEKSIDISVNSTEKTDINIISVGNEESVIKLNTSGKAIVSADKEIDAISYDTINAKVVNVETEAEEPGKEERSIKMDLNSFLLTWLEEDKKTVFSLDKDTFKLGFHDDTELIEVNDDNIKISFKNGEETIIINSDNIDVSYKNGEEKITLSPNLIKLLTGAKVEMNNAKEPLTLAETLIQKIDELQNQINTLKMAWSQAAANVKPMDGGATGFAAGVTATSSIAKIDFSDIKSEVSFSD